jgi:hypothetical protein
MGISIQVRLAASLGLWRIASHRDSKNAWNGESENQHELHGTLPGGAASMKECFHSLRFRR